MLPQCMWILMSMWLRLFVWFFLFRCCMIMLYYWYCSATTGRTLLTDESPTTAFNAVEYIIQPLDTFANVVVVVVRVSVDFFAECVKGTTLRITTAQHTYANTLTFVVVCSRIKDAHSDTTIRHKRLCVWEARRRCETSQTI